MCNVKRRWVGQDNCSKIVSAKVPPTFFSIRLLFLLCLFGILRQGLIIIRLERVSLIFFFNYYLTLALTLAVEALQLQLAERHPPTVSFTRAHLYGPSVWQAHACSRAGSSQQAHTAHTHCCEPSYRQPDGASLYAEVWVPLSPVHSETESRRTKATLLSLPLSPPWTPDPALQRKVSTVHHIWQNIVLDRKNYSSSVVVIMFCGGIKLKYVAGV